jgi:hypothetical protein
MKQHTHRWIENKVAVIMFVTKNFILDLYNDVFRC